MYSIIAARVVDFPEPVVPVVNIIPLGLSAISFKTGGRFNSSIDFADIGIVLIAIATLPL